MQGGLHSPNVDARTLAQAMLVHDLMLAGVRTEVVEDPFDWLPVPKPKVVPVAAPVAVVGAGAAMPGPMAPAGDGATPASDSAGAAAFRSALADFQAMDQAKVAARERKDGGKAGTVKAATPAATVWHGGQPGGVVLVLRTAPEMQAKAGDALPLNTKATALMTRILRACGLHEQPLGWVVISSATDMVQPNLKPLLQAAVLELQPQNVLMLGQAAVGSLAGQSLGVEGWQAAPRNLLEGFSGRLGVTYPPELLLIQPMFKRLAWQHLNKFYSAQS